MLVALAFVALGLVLLVYASERFVEGAAGIAFRLNLPAVIVGAVIVGFGTSLPELLVSGIAAAGDNLDIAIGNVTGSNIANMTLALGLVAILAAPTITSRALSREVPLAIAAMALLAVLVGRLTRLDGIILVVGFVVAMAIVFLSDRGLGDDELGAEADEELHEKAKLSPAILGLLTLGGLVGTVAGAQLLVSGALRAADELGLGEGLVGFTLVAIGTSLPEIVTCIQAARKNEAELAVGNVLGSNLFNSLAIAGTAALVGPGDVSNGLFWASWVAVGTGALMWGMMSRGKVLHRWEGGVLVAIYFASIPLVT
ncbi:MAG TPA: calcium/sodium antiporter [Acidimicrobiales bacterium]|nr:calcium/sodium antiporter [Acidimicrobiales bacterium]